MLYSDIRMRHNTTQQGRRDHRSVLVRLTQDQWDDLSRAIGKLPFPVSRATYVRTVLLRELERTTSKPGVRAAS